MFSGEATNTNCIVFALARPGLEHIIYHTRDEHTNHYYTTDAINVTCFRHDIAEVLLILR